METTHFSVVHGHGNAVSPTYTLNGDFGAYLVPAGTCPAFFAAISALTLTMAAVYDFSC